MDRKLFQQMMSGFPELKKHREGKPTNVRIFKRMLLDRTPDEYRELLKSPWHFYHIEHVLREDRKEELRFRQGKTVFTSVWNALRTDDLLRESRSFMHLNGHYPYAQLMPADVPSHWYPSRIPQELRNSLTKYQDSGTIDK